VVNGVVTDLVAVTKALKQLWADNRFECRNVILGITSQQVVVRDLTLPNLPADQMAKALPYQAADVIPLPIEQTLIDFTPLGEVDSDAETISGLLIATPREPVVAAVAAVERSGLHVARVDLCSFAALRSIADEKLSVEAVVDLGAQLTNIVIHAQGIPKVVRTVSRGGHELTLRLVQRADLSTDEAERAKREQGLTGDHLDIVDLISDGIRPLLAEIRSSVHYFGSANPSMVLERISLTGGASRLPGLADAITEQLGVPTGLVDPMQHIRNRWANKDVQQAEAQHAATAVSIGLAMGAAG
jgi:type IV pilus assembly protein PilM